MRIAIRVWFQLSLALGLGAALWLACGRDARLADRKLRRPEVKTVTHYGVTLDKNASPKQVAYVLLRAIRDDVLTKTDEQRQHALDIQFDVCAAGEIQKINPTSLTPDEFVFQVVHRWTPTVSHYVRDFEMEWEEADARLVTARPRTAKGSANDADQRQVLMEVKDPSGEPNAQVVLVIWLVRDEGYWRVSRLGFDPRRRSLKTRTTATGESNESAPATGD